MKKILLPLLYKEKKIGKNVIKQFLTEKTAVTPSSIEVNDHYLILICNDSPVCIVQKGKAFPQALQKCFQSM